MSRFAIRNPYVIIVACLIIAVVGVVSVLRMPVDLFPPINIPVVVVATFYGGMPPEQVENDITGRFERFFTLASGIDHIESRSLTGVSLIKIYFQPGTNADTAVSSISNLAMADLRRLPQVTLPPVVLKFDASSLPVCLVTLGGKGLSETELRDLGQFSVRNQISNVPGASVPQPFGGRYRQIMVYVDPLKLQAHELSPMDVVRAVNATNLILPAGDVKIGPYDYSIYSNSQIGDMHDLDEVPLKTVGFNSVVVGDVGQARDAHQIQYNVVRVNGQPSVYLPIMKQGGDTNTIQVVDGIRTALTRLVGEPKNLVTKVVFDQSVLVRQAIETLVHEGLIGMFLTCLMILIFLGNMRATVAVFLSIPLSALATFLTLSLGSGTLNTMVLGGLALVFSRVIDNSVVVLENIFRHLELGESAHEAAEKGGREVAIAVLAATLTTAVVFFPVTFLYGVSKFLFTALAVAVVITLFASYFVAMTVVPVFCAKFLTGTHAAEATAAAGEDERDDELTAAEHVAPHQHQQLPEKHGWAARFNGWFNRSFDRLLDAYGRALRRALQRPMLVVAGSLAVFLASLALYPLVGLAFFPRTDAGQFVINVKAPTGTRLELTSGEVRKVEDLIRGTIPSGDLGMIVSNVGVTPSFGAIYSSNSAPHTAFIQVGLKPGHKVGSYEYMERVRRRMAAELPELRAYFQSGGLVDAILNMGMPAPIDVQVSTPTGIHKAYDTALRLAAQIRKIPNVSDVFIPQDLDYPALQLDINRERAAQLGLSQKEVISDVTTALTSDGMIAPSYWVDPKTGNDYLLTVQYPEDAVNSLSDLRTIPVRPADGASPAPLENVAAITRIEAPTEMDHYQLQRTIDIYVSTKGEDLGRAAHAINAILAAAKPPEGVEVNLRGMVQGMLASFRSFGIGLCLAVVLLYLVLVAQFGSFLDPLLILLAVPPGLTGVLLALLLTGTTLNVQSLMGVVMMVGIVVSNSILIVEFTRRLRGEGMPLEEAVAVSCRIRLRPILMTSLATLIGLLPMALKLGEGSEAYAPLARAIIGGLGVSVVTTVFIVPAAYVLAYRKRSSGEVQA
jgi:HAE1 family hydrophobic/amphiphilic exporter-1